MGTLDGQHALVTGGGSGIGAAIARRLAQDGALVTLAGRSADKLLAVASELAGAAAVVADVTREADCLAMVAAARAAHGPLDIVVANAGAAESSAFAQTDADLWARMIDANLTGAYFTAHAAIADLTAPTGGTMRKRLIFIASTAGFKGYPYVAAYVAAKHGVVGLARALAVECGRTPLSLEQAIEAEAQAQAICMQTKDFKRAYDAFVAKQKPRFAGD